MKKTCVCAECAEEAYRYPYNLGYMRAARPAMDATFLLLQKEADKLATLSPPPRDAHDQMRDAFLNRLYGRQPEEYALSFEEANALDDYFFGTGSNNAWRQAYNLPQEGQTLAHGHAAARNVGMFTFTLT